MKKTFLFGVVAPVLLSALVLTSCSHQGTSTSDSRSSLGHAKLSFFMTKPQAMTPVELVADSEYVGKTPKNYRVNKSLRMSASATFGALGLREIARSPKKGRHQVFIFDLRQESHGLINDIPVTWTADREWAMADLNHDEALRRERRLLGDLQVGAIWNGKKIDSLETEESMVRSAGHQYVRLVVTEHVRPIDSEVDRFIETVRALPANSWVHFHDRTGKGRTTLFMILYDMLNTADRDSYDVIVARNLELSQEPDFFELGDEKSWQYPFNKERGEFVKKFYEYAKAHPRGENKTWSEWIL